MTVHNSYKDDDDYTLLEGIYRDTCYSNSDYEDRLCYGIIEEIEQKINASASKLVSAICARSFMRINRSCGAKSLRDI